MIGSDKFEVDAVRAINSKAPDFMMLLVKLFSMKVKDERILPKEIGLGCSFALNRLGKFAEQPVRLQSSTVRA
jgi:hypothetical protein